MSGCFILGHLFLKGSRYDDDIPDLVNPYHCPRFLVGRERMKAMAVQKLKEQSMPTFKTGNMWTVFDEVDLFLITTNATIKRNGAVVMGRGIARQARDRFSGLDAALGRRILTVCGNQGQYGLLVSPRWPQAKLGAFQVKRHYSQSASLELIQHSVAALYAWCAAHPDAQIALNFPGIGNGRLRREDVLSIVMQLPDQVSVWEYSSASREAAR